MSPGHEITHTSTPSALHLNVRLFGKFCALCNGHVVDGLYAHKVQELFCYLLLYRERPHARETLASLLWGDNSTAQSKTYLRKALWQLQAALDSQTKPHRIPVLLVEPDWVQINSKAELWLDVALFEQAFTLVQNVPGMELDCPCVQVLQQAVDLYRGDLLNSWYLDWCVYERERLQNMLLVMLDKLMGYCETQHTYDSGLVYGMRILRFDSARERTHRRLMRLHYMAGDRTAALRQYDRCVVALEKELGVRPDERTITLYEQIRANECDGLAAAPARARSSSVALTSPLTEALERLSRLQSALADIQHQLQQYVERIEDASNDQL